MTCMHSTFLDVFKSVLDRHAPLKRKMIRGNQGPFLTKQLTKAIMDRSKLRNRYIKLTSRENFMDYKKQKTLAITETNSQKSLTFKNLLAKVS